MMKPWSARAIATVLLAPALLGGLGCIAERTPVFFPPSGATGEERARAFTRYRMSVGGETQHPTRGDDVRAALVPGRAVVPASRAVGCTYLGVSPECRSAADVWGLWLNVGSLDARVRRWSTLRAAGLGLTISGAAGVVGSGLALALVDDRSNLAVPLVALGASVAMAITGLILLRASSPDDAEVAASARAFNLWLRDRAGLGDSTELSVDPAEPTRVSGPEGAAQAVDPERVRP